MATTRLKNLKVTKVDFVDEGANPDAHIKLFKSKGADDGAAETIDTPGEPSGAQESGILGWLTAIGKKLGIQKDAQTFGEKVTEVELSEIAEEMWSMCAALAESLRSILYDGDMDGEKADSMMQLSLSQFNETMGKAIGSWANGKTSEIKKVQNLDGYSLEMLEKTRDQLQEYIQKARVEKGGLEEMIKIDKSKMSPEELEQYNGIIAKYAVDVPDEGVEKSTQVDPEDNEDEIDDDTQDQKKACGGKKPTQKSVGAEAGSDDDVFKGMTPEAKEMIESLKKFKDDAETKELNEVAKKYAQLGKKPEELVPMFKSLRAAGGDAYDNMIAMLDSTLATVESSGVFGEIGKSGGRPDGYGYTGVQKGAAETKIEGIAKGYREKDPSLSYHDSIAKAWENHPEVYEEYEDEAGF